MNLLKNKLLPSGLFISLSTIALAEIKLPAFFSDSMVLQQESGANIWGWADAGQDVTVSYEDQTETSKADENGKWKLTLKGLKASKKGAILKITAGSEHRQLSDVVVGEVWIASGQSNMEWSVEKSGSKTGATTAEDDLLRIYVSENRTANTTQTDFKGQWRTVKPSQTLKFTAVGYEFGKSLRKKLDIPVGIIECAWGGKPVEAFISDQALEALPEAKVVIDSKKAALLAWTKKSKGQNQPNKKNHPSLNPKLHSTIYNGMIAPLSGYSSRGVIWYQGESNTKGGTDNIYGELLECLIQNWREQWGSNLSFYYVQLANYEKGAMPGWVQVQDEMRRLMDDKEMQEGNIGMATINDIGHATNIHPTNKKDVGLRLARWALNKDYGMKDIVVSGPLYTSHELKNDTIEISFNHAEGLKSRDGESLGSFEIAGADSKWVSANATLSGNKVVVSSETIKSPTQARYAWAPYPKGANLVNAEGLPTSCFITK